MRVRRLVVLVVLAGGSWAFGTMINPSQAGSCSHAAVVVNGRESFPQNPCNPVNKPSGWYDGCKVAAYTVAGYGENVNLCYYKPYQGPIGPIEL